MITLEAVFVWTADDAIGAVSLALLLLWFLYQMFIAWKDERDGK